MIALLQEPRRAADCDDLLKMANKSRYIGLITPQEFEKWLAHKQIVLLYQQDALQGFGAWDVIDAHWCELGPFFIRKGARGRGYARRIIVEMRQLNSGSKHFAVTKNGVMAHLLTQSGLQPIKYPHLPQPVLQHLRQKLTLNRVYHLARKFSLDAPQYFVSETGVA